MNAGEGRKITPEFARWVLISKTRKETDNQKNRFPARRAAGWPAFYGALTLKNNVPFDLRTQEKRPEDLLTFDS